MNAQKARGAQLDTGKMTDRVKALVDVYKRQVQQDDMAALLAADGKAVLAHVFQHVAVAHGGLFGVDAPVSYTHLYKII